MPAALCRYLLCLSLPDPRCGGAMRCQVRYARALLALPLLVLLTGNAYGAPCASAASGTMRCLRLATSSRPGQLQVVTVTQDVTKAAALATPPTALIDGVVQKSL